MKWFLLGIRSHCGGGGVERGYLDIWYLIFRGCDIWYLDFCGGQISDIWFFYGCDIWYLTKNINNINSWFIVEGDALNPTYPITPARKDVLSDMILQHLGDRMVPRGNLPSNPTMNEVLATGRSIIAIMRDGLYQNSKMTGEGYLAGIMLADIDWLIDWLID